VRKITLSIIMLVLLSTVQVMAQGVVTYGSAVVATLEATAPVAVFTFQGTEGDQVTIQGIAITPGLDLTLSVQNGAQILVSSEGDPYAASPDDVRADFNLPANGTYVVIVTSAVGSTGDFLFKIAGQAAAEKTVITGIPADVPITAGATTYYSYTGTADTTTTLSLTTASPDLQFLAVVRNNTGQIVSTSSGTSALVSLMGEGPYEIALSGVTQSMEGVVTVSLVEDLTDATPPPQPTEPADTGDTPPPVVTEEVAPDNTGACFVSSGGVVNVRSAPSTDATVLTQTQAGQAYPVSGTDSFWYLIDVAGIGVGWVFSDVVTTSGDCSNVPLIIVEFPEEQPTTAPDTGQPTATYTPSYTPTVAQQQDAPTATYTPSYTPTEPAQQPTATYTPSYTPTTQPAPQLAPEDARFNNPLNIQLDSTASVLDFVSYPDGDSEDRVRWDILGMNQNSSMTGGRARLVISVSCFGEGTDQIQFFTGGQTYACGSTIVDQEVTFNSKTGSVVITAVGGSNTYVQWVLTGTATRVN